MKDLRVTNTTLVLGGVVGYTLWEGIDIRFRGVFKMFEVHGRVVKVSAQSRDIFKKKMLSVRNAKQNSQSILTKGPAAGYF